MSFYIEKPREAAGEGGGSGAGRAEAGTTEEGEQLRSVEIGMQADVEAIDSIRIAHVAALNVDDAEGWLAVFAEDGVQMPPNATSPL